MFAVAGQALVAPAGAPGAPRASTSAPSHLPASTFHPRPQGVGRRGGRALLPSRGAPLVVRAQAKPATASPATAAGSTALTKDVALDLYEDMLKVGARDGRDGPVPGSSSSFVFWFLSARLLFPPIHSTPGFPSPPLFQGRNFEDMCAQARPRTERTRAIRGGRLGSG